MAEEIERKFLVAQLPPELEDAPATRIDQGYVAIHADGTEVRVRRRDANATLTVKGPSRDSGLARVEVELQLDAGAFAQLWPLTEGRRVEKTRHLLPVEAEDLRIELDVYAGALEGLMVAEVEFAGAAAARAFRGPAWLGPEVTADDRYKNQRLALDGRPAPVREVPPPSG